MGVLWWCLRVRCYVMAETGLLDHVSLFDLVRDAHFYLLSGNVVVVLLLLVFKRSEMTSLAWNTMFTASRLVLRLWRLNSYVLLTVLVSTQLILLQLNAWNILCCLHSMTWKVLWTSLATYFVDLRNFFTTAIWIVNISRHITIAILIFFLHLRLSSRWILSLDNFQALAFLLRIFANRDLLLLNDNTLLFRLGLLWVLDISFGFLDRTWLGWVPISLQMSSHERVGELTAGNCHRQ